MTEFTERVICVLAASYFAWALRDIQSVLYLFAVAIMIRLFIQRPELFPSAQPESTTTMAHEQVSTPVSTPLPVPQPIPAKSVYQQAAQEAPLSRKVSSTNPRPSLPSTTRGVSQSPIVPSHNKVSHVSFASTSYKVQQQQPAPVPAPVVVDELLMVTDRPSTPSKPRTETRRAHRIPGISSGQIPTIVTPVLTTSPVPVSPPRPTLRPFLIERPLKPIVASLKPAAEIEEEKTPTRGRVVVAAQPVAVPAGPTAAQVAELEDRVLPRRSKKKSIASTPSHSCGYDSDSSRASTSSSRSTSRSTTSSTHSRHSRKSSYGLPTYEKHYTQIVTMMPKRTGYLLQIQAILKAVRPYWLSLPGSVSHEVGHDSESGTIVIVETYESKDDVQTFERSKERQNMMNKLKPFIDEDKTIITRLPGSSAATRYR